VAFLALLIILCAFSQDNLRDRVEEKYLSQIGVREATGFNDGVQVEAYLHSTGLGKGFAWCAAFVNWVYLETGVTKVAGSAWSPLWFQPDYVVYQPSKKIYKKFPDTGDVFGIWLENKGRIAHVGFIHRWTDGNFVTTAEGNTNDAGSREGDGVYIKKRLKRQIYAVSNYIDK
jgi:hypothetical protein